MEDNKVEVAVVNDCLTNAESIYESTCWHTAPVKINVSKEDYVAGSIDELVGTVEVEKPTEEEGDNKTEE